jgi:hypothetical protein
MARYKIIIAFLIAPLAVPFVLWLNSLPKLLVDVYSGNYSGQSAFSVLLKWLLIYSVNALPFAYVCEVLLGIPAWLSFRRYGVHAWSAFAAGGAALGFAFFLSIWFLGAILDPSARSNFLSSPYIWMDPLAGLCSAVLFRAVLFSRQSGDKSIARSNS